MMDEVGSSTATGRLALGGMGRPLLLSLVGVGFALLPVFYLLAWELFPGVPWVNDFIEHAPFSASVALSTAGVGALLSSSAAVWATAMITRSKPADLKAASYVGFFLTSTVGAMSLGFALGFTLFLAGWRF